MSVRSLIYFFYFSPSFAEAQIGGTRASFPRLQHHSQGSWLYLRWSRRRINFGRKTKKYLSEKTLLRITDYCHNLFILIYCSQESKKKFIGYFEPNNCCFSCRNFNAFIAVQSCPFEQGELSGFRKYISSYFFFDPT